MDPLSQLALASSIIQFIDFSFKLVKAADEVRHSASGAIEEIDDATVVSKNLQSMLRRLRTPSTITSVPKEDENLVTLANKCSNVCVELQTLVDNVQGKGYTSKAGSFKVAWKSMRQSGKVMSLEKRLDSFRSQILGHVIVMMSEKQSTTNSLIEKLTATSQTMAQATRKELRQSRRDILDMIQSQLRAHTTMSSSNTNSELLLEVKGALDKISANKEVSGPMQPLQRYNCDSGSLSDIRNALSEILTAVKRIPVEDQVLEWLWYPELHSREISIAEAQDKTYRWLLYGNEDAQGRERSQYSSLSGNWSTGFIHADCLAEQERQRKRTDFSNWLQNGNGVFYVSGKAGSGKSTLMKYLSEDSRTRDYLDKWARKGQKDLIFAKFFFWTSGSKLQRSIEGLYRGILYEVLRQCPKLIPVVFPAELLDSLHTGTGHTRGYNFQPRLSTLENAFKLLVEHTDVLRHRNICLFIDGLDEYEGDYWKLSKQLKQWCDSKSVKICASSRPYNEFQQIFTSNNTMWLRLHELTQFDMFRFVSAAFNNDERFLEAQRTSAEYKYLIGAIIHRAEGVFLWVRLVVQSLLKGIGNSCSITQLRKTLDIIPNGLNAFFQQIIDRIEVEDRAKAARNLLVMQSNSCPAYISHSVYIHAMLDDLEDDPDFKASLLGSTARPSLTTEEFKKKCPTMCTRLIGRLQGLVEIEETDGILPLCHGIRFIHRTFSDFLKTPDALNYLARVSNGFSASRALPLCILAVLKFLPSQSRLECPLAEYVLIDPNRQEQSIIIDLVFELLRMNSLQKSTTNTVPLLREVKSLHRIVAKVGASNLTRQCHFWQVRFPDTRRNGWGIKPAYNNTIDASILCWEALHRDDELAKSLIIQKPQILHKSPHDILLASLMASIYTRYRGLKPSLYKLLLANLSINQESAAFLEHDGCSKWPSPLTQQTTWTHFLLYLTYVFQSGKPGYTEVDKPALFQTLKQCLQYGADPSVCFVGYTYNDIPSTQHTKISGYFYTDLLTGIGLWGLEVAQDIQWLIGRGSGSWPWKLIDVLASSLFGLQDSMSGIEFFDADRLKGCKQVVVEVMSLASLEDISKKKLREVSGIILKKGLDGIHLML